MHGVEKKEIRMHMEAVNAGYDYVNPTHAYITTRDNIGNCSITEHHYDVPNLAAKYVFIKFLIFFLYL